MPASAESFPPTDPASRSLEALGHLVDALSGCRISLQWLSADKPGTEHTRPILRADKLLLPADTDDDLRLAAIAHAAAHLLFSPAAQAVGKLKPMGIAMASTIEDARVERLLIARYPGLHAPLRRKARRAAFPISSPASTWRCSTPATRTTVTGSARVGGCSKRKPHDSTIRPRFARSPRCWPTTLARCGCE